MSPTEELADELGRQMSSLSFAATDAVLEIVIDNPRSPVNAVDPTLHEELRRLFALLREESRCRAVLLTGSGRAFSAGGDFDWLSATTTVEQVAALHRAAKQLIWNLLDVEVPIVAAVNGPAVGLGASIALLCDIIVMADTATLADPHVRVGVVAGDGGTVAWPLAVGPARAKQYLLTGDPVGALEAERIGLVNRVVPADACRAEAMAMAQRLAGAAPLAVRWTKASVNQIVKNQLTSSFDLSTALEMLTFLSADKAEAVAALRGGLAPGFDAR